MHKERECTHVLKHVMCKYIIVYILCMCLSVHIMSLSSWLRWMAAELKLPLQSLCVERLFGTTRLPFVSGRNPVNPKLCAEPSRPGRAATDIPSLVGNSKHPLGYQEATELISHNLFHEKREKENKYLLSLHVLIFHHSFIFGSKGQRGPLIFQLYKVIYQSCSESWLWSLRLIDESQDSKLLQPGAIMKVVPGCSLGTWLIIGYSMI